ncbi:hypothetical protein F4818DRAFT_457330 [Hypoxylon cercidicola]|nr:hypothetical protein F4818DRAFT_457330 [Hypoxylon cercidicola]
MSGLLRNAGLIGSGESAETVGPSLTRRTTSPQQDQHLTPVTPLQYTKESGRRATFLGLPAEIRLMIYRLLFRVGELLDTDNRRRRRSSQILRTCRFILNEARPVLYGGNIWEVKARLADLKKAAYMDRAEGRKRRRYDSNQQYLRIHFDHSPKCAPFHRILARFGSLRRVRDVVVDGVPPACAKYLTDKMTGSSPPDPLPKMYDALANYVGCFQFNVDHLDEVFRTIDEADVDRFKEMRARIVESINRDMNTALECLYEHDASS